MLASRAADPYIDMLNITASIVQVDSKFHTSIYIIELYTLTQTHVEKCVDWFLVFVANSNSPISEINQIYNKILITSQRQ